MNRLLLKLSAASLLLPSLAAVVMLAPAVRAQDCGLLIQSRKLDGYGDLSAEEEWSRLEKLAAALEEERGDTKAFIIGYAGRAGRAGDAIKRADRAKETLVEKSAFYNTRINTLDCGRRESPATELWLTPAGASPPRCSPTLDPLPAPAKDGRARRRSGRL